MENITSTPTPTQTNELKKYQDIVHCLSQTATQLNKLNIATVLEHLDQSENLIQDLLLEEKEPLFSESLHQVAYQITFQRKVLNDKILKQYSQEKSYLLHDDDDDDIDPLPSVNDEPDKTSSSTSSAMDTSNQKSDLEDGRIENRRNMIAAMKKDPGTGGLDSIAGLSVAKQLLKEAVVLPMQFPHLFTGSRHAWNRVLLYGPPGTGKTRLAQAIASEVSVAFYCVSSADILSCWVGESEKLIRELFQYTRGNNEQSIIFIDEVDGLCRKRTSNEEDRSRRLKNQFLTQLENSSTTQQDTVFLLCATNCPWELDSAFLRRFQRRIYIPLPDRNARYQILTLHSNGVDTNMTDADWQLLLDRTEGYSGSDLANLTLSALMEPVREIGNSIHWNFTPSGKIIPCTRTTPGMIRCSLKDVPPELVSARPVVLRDFLKALSNTSPTVCIGDIERFDQFTASFGQNG